LGPGIDLGRVGLGDLADVAEDHAQVAHGLDDVAAARLALGADHGRALGDAAQGLAEVGGAADEGHRERPLVDVVHLVGRRDDVHDHAAAQHLGQPSLDAIGARLAFHTAQSMSAGSYGAGVAVVPTGWTSIHVVPAVSLMGAPVTSVHETGDSGAGLDHLPL